MQVKIANGSTIELDYRHKDYKKIITAKGEQLVIQCLERIDKIIELPNNQLLCSVYPHSVFYIIDALTGSKIKSFKSSSNFAVNKVTAMQCMVLLEGGLVAFHLTNDYSIRLLDLTDQKEEKIKLNYSFADVECMVALPGNRLAVAGKYQSSPAGHVHIFDMNNLSYLKSFKINSVKLEVRNIALTTDLKLITYCASKNWQAKLHLKQRCAYIPFTLEGQQLPRQWLTTSTLNSDFAGYELLNIGLNKLPLNDLPLSAWLHLASNLTQKDLAKLLQVNKFLQKYKPLFQYLDKTGIGLFDEVNTLVHGKYSLAALMIRIASHQTIDVNLIDPMTLLKRDKQQYTALRMAVEAKNTLMIYHLTNCMLTNFMTDNAVDNEGYADESGSSDEENSSLHNHELECSNARTSELIINEVWQLAIQQNYQTGLAKIFSAFDCYPDEWIAFCLAELLKDGIKYAATYNHLELTAYLLLQKDIYLQINKNICFFASDLVNAFVAAIHFNHIDCVLLILNHPTFDIKYIDTKDEHGHTALHYAYDRGDENLIKILLECGANPNLLYYDQNYLVRAIIDNQFSIFRIMLESPPVKINQLVEFEGTQTTLMHVAVKYQRIDMIKLLLANQSDPSILNKAGFSALHLAAKRGYLDCLTILLQSTSHLVDQLTMQSESYFAGWTPAYLAINNNHFEVVQYLAQMGANLALPISQNKKGVNSNGCTSLEVALNYKRFEIVKWLIQQKNIVVTDLSLATLDKFSVKEYFYLHCIIKLKWKIQQLKAAQNNQPSSANLFNKRIKLKVELLGMQAVLEDLLSTQQHNHQANGISVNHYLKNLIADKLTNHETARKFTFSS